MTHHLCQENNRKYRPCDYVKNGFYIGHFKASSINFDLLRTKIIDSRIFEDKTVSWPLFNDGHDIGEVDEGRNQVSIASFKKKQKLHYCDILSDINTISDRLIETCNDDLGYKINKNNSILTILETTTENSGPQLMHVDMGYDNYSYREQLLCLIAIQDNTYFRLLRGSHSYDTLEELQNVKTKTCGTSTSSSDVINSADDHKQLLGNGGFMIPTVITLKQGQFIVMHPKLFHSGWLADGHNIRIHFYFNLKQIKLSSNRKTQQQAETYIMENQIAELFNGTARSNQIKNLKSLSLKKVKNAKAKKVERFGSTKWK